MTIDINVGMLDRIEFGLPYHGLWRAGGVTLPNGTVKTGFPTPINGVCTVLKVPGKAAPNRSPAQLAVDAAAGIEWRNYGLISDKFYGPLLAEPTSVPEINKTVVFFIDAAKLLWQMQISKLATTDKMSVRLRRILHISETADVWSPTIEITVPHHYWDYTTHPLVMCQSTTGRDFVLVSTYTDAYAKTMMRVRVTGAVNVSASDLGLTWDFEVLYTAADADYTEIKREIVAGIDTYTEHHFYRLSSESAPSFEQIIVYEDGIFMSDSGPPPGWPGGDYQSTPAYDYAAHSGEKTYSFENSIVARRPLWGGYVGDDLRLLTFEYRDRTLALAHMVTGSGMTDHSWVVDSNTHTSSVKFMYGDYLISSADFSEDVGGDVYPSGWGEHVIDYPTDHQPISGTQVRDTFTRSGWPMVINLSSQGGWRTGPLVIAATRTWVAGVTTYTPNSVVAPSGKTVTASGDIDSIYATWQPVTDDLVVDTQVVCWF